MKRGSEMTAPQAVSQQNPSKVAFGKVLAIQIVAYVVLVALALVPGIAYGDSANPAVVPFTIIGSLAMIALLVVFSPFRDGTAGHVIAVIAGLLSVVCATTMTLGRAIFAADATGGKDFSMEDGWIAGVGGLLILLIVISFGRQMARENRTHLIRSLSHSVVEGVAMIASAGWDRHGRVRRGAAGDRGARRLLVLLASRRRPRTDRARSVDRHRDAAGHDRRCRGRHRRARRRDVLTIWRLRNRHNSRI